MSWLKDLAGQAEGLLNQLDQTAGDALSTSRTPSRAASVRSARISPSRSAHQPDVSHASQPTPRDYKSSGYASSVSSQRKVERDADQDLLEFLNEEPARSVASHSRRSSTASGASAPHAAMSREVVETGVEEESGDAEAKVDRHRPARAGRLERELIEARARELDQGKAMAAKDSQLAVLRVRLQEADASLTAKTTALTSLREEKERLLRDSADSSQVRDAALTALQEQLAEAQSELESEKAATRRAEADYRARIHQLESETAQLAAQLTQTQKLHTEQQLESTESVQALRLAKYNLEANKKDFDEYKQKAQKTLQAKEKLIETLKSGGDGSEGEESLLELRAELEELRSERDLLKDDLGQAQLGLYNLRTDMQELESGQAAEQRAGLEAQRELQQSVQSAQLTANHYQDQLHHLQKEHQIVQDELRRQQASMQRKLQEKDEEIHRLMTTKTGRGGLGDSTAGGTSAAEAEARIRGLTESLIQKQMTIESLQTEKNSLSLQLERMERHYEEAEAAAIRHVSLPMESSEGGGGSSGPLPAFLRRSPYDSGVARGIKHVAVGLDMASGWAGYGEVRGQRGIVGHYDEAEAAAIRHVSLPMESSEGGGGSSGPLPAFLRRSPYDSGVARGIKHVAAGLDLASARLGHLLRRYPAARSSLFLYIIILHLWVMFVLLTYSPEMHSPDYQPLPQPHAP